MSGCQFSHLPWNPLQEAQSHLLLFGVVVSTAHPCIWHVEAIKAELQSGLSPRAAICQAPCPGRRPLSRVSLCCCFLRSVFNISRQETEALLCKDEAEDSQLLLAEPTPAISRLGTAADRGLPCRVGVSLLPPEPHAAGRPRWLLQPCLSLEAATQRGTGTPHVLSWQPTCHCCHLRCHRQATCTGLAGKRALGPEANNFCPPSPPDGGITQNTVRTEGPYSSYP